MADKKVVVPDGIMQACHEFVPWHPSNDPTLRNTLEVALRWLAENPIVPTPAQMKELYVSQLDIDYSVPFDAVRAVVTEWQRRMFLAPEPEIPEEIKDLLRDKEKVEAGGASTLEAGIAAINADIVEAYRRGQKAGK